MTRLEKKCFMFSVGMHCVLLGVLVVSSAFRDKPDPPGTMVLSFIPPTLLDTPGVGGPKAAEPQPQQQPPAQAAPAPQPPAPQPPQIVQTPVTPPTPHFEKPPPVKPIVHEQVVEHIEPPKPRHPDREQQREEQVEKSLTGEPTPKPPKKRHEITPSFESASNEKTRKNVKPDKSNAEAEAAAAAASAAADARRQQRAIRQALNGLATSVQTSGARATAIDMPGETSGTAFANYNTVIKSLYFNAWILPDGVANKSAKTRVKIVVARDGTILSAEVIGRSGESDVDRSVEKALRKVDHLPPFPKGAPEDQRSFILDFKPEMKDQAG